MSTEDDCTSLNPGSIRFYDNSVPALEVGDYMINVTQRINPQNTAPPIDECYAASQFFSVRGLRYTLPPGDIFSVYPPNNAQGVFDQVLPNVVLTKRDLPWERNIFYDADLAHQTPWLALLLFVEGEQIGGQNALMKTAKIPAFDMFNHPSNDGILWPGLNAEWYETEEYLKKTICTVIDISPEAFKTLVPSKADLSYLAHVRQVDPTAKDSDVLKVSSDGWYSVIVGNRLPDAPPAGSGKPGKLNIAHLVSLEGLEDYITNPASIPTDKTGVRLISFKSWKFTCLPELGESFSELMKGLLTDNHGNEKGASFTLPPGQPVEISDATQYASQVIENGYVPLSYQTRLGEQTFAWYRGPFSPVPTKNFISSSQQTVEDPAGFHPFARASDAIIYDKNYGIFDVSYGVAWETGRLLALSNAYFGQEMLDWERKAHALIDLILERKSQIPALQNFDPDNPDPTTEKALLDQIDSYAVTGDFMTYLITQFSAQIAPKFGEEPPASSAQPLPSYPTMPSPPANPQTIQDLLSEADVQELVRAQGGQKLETIADWLAQLYLLTWVPFENLVPDGRLLPEESIRFFYIDSNWMDALVEGALSIGIESSRDRLYQDLMKDLIWNTTFKALQQVRDNLLGDWAERMPTGSTIQFDQESMAGMLLRSAVVSGWPGLQIRAYLQTMPDPANAGSVIPDPSTFIKLLRMERLSEDIMLCMWPAVPAVIAVEEPHEGISFGFEDPPSGEGCYLYLRSLAASNYGMPLGNSVAINAEEFIDSNRIIKITASGGLVSAIRNKLPNSPTVNVRDFAVQMIKVPEQAVFAQQSLVKQK